MHKKTNLFGPLGQPPPPMATAAILNFFNPSKAATHYGGYSYKVS